MGKILEKLYKRIMWENEPSEKTPLNEENLNKIDFSVDALDNRVIEQNTIKLDKEIANTMVKDVFFNNSNGIFTITYLNGTTVNLDTKLEKLAVNFSYDSVNRRLVITLDDGTKQYVDLSSLISEYEFLDTDTISLVVFNGKVMASVKDGSITENKLQTNYLAEIKVETEKSRVNAANAKISEEKSKTSETNSAASAAESKSYAVGGTGTRPNENIDNAEYYYLQTKGISESNSGALKPAGTVIFANLPPLSSTPEGYMYNVSNQFISTSNFKEGAGNVFPAGSNVYKTVDGYWDVLAGTPVTGVKGNSESSYRRGNVNITKENIGLGNVPNVVTNDQTPTFTQATARQALTSGDKISILFSKLAKWIADLKDAAFAQIANNDTTTAAGYVADARIVKVHGVEIDALNTSLATHKTSADHDGRYYTETEVNNLLNAKQNANTAINTSNIGNQSVNYATWAGTANNVAWPNVTGNPFQLNAENSSIIEIQYYYSSTYKVLQIIVKLSDGSSKTFTLN